METLKSATDGDDDCTMLIAQFAAYQVLRGWQPRTIERRTQTLTMFARLVPLAAATTDHVEQFLARYSAPRTRHAYRSDLRTFYGWAVRRGHMHADPTADIDPIKTPSTLPRPIDARRVPDLLATGDRDTLLMVALAVLAGLRRSEIAALCRADVSDSHVTVRSGKGRKDRAVPLHPILAAMVAGRPAGPLFHVGPDSVGARIKDHLHAHGVEATAHQLRHTFGTELAKASHGDLLMIAQFMGHASTTTTMGYTRLAAERGATEVAGLFGAA